MDFKEYQKLAITVAKYPDIGNNFVYPTLGLSGETGEVAEKIKKIIRDDNGMVSVQKREELKKELGDVMWYIAMLATELSIDLDDIATHNIEKLVDRLDRGVIKGSGDNR